MGGCVCKLEGNEQIASPGIESKQLQATSSGLTINNNYSNNTISFIDGTSAATAAFPSSGKHVDESKYMFNDIN